MLMATSSSRLSLSGISFLSLARTQPRPDLPSDFWTRSAFYAILICTQKCIKVSYTSRRLFLTVSSSPSHSESLPSLPMLLPALSGLIKSLRALISLSVHWEWPPLLLLLWHSPFGLLPCHRHCFLCTELLMMWQIIIASSRLPNCRQFSVSKEGEQAQWDTHTHSTATTCGVCRVRLLCCGLSKCIQAEWAAAASASAPLRLSSSPPDWPLACSRILKFLVCALLWRLVAASPLPPT